MVDLAAPDFRALPDDFTYVLHLAASIEMSTDFDHALRVNAEGTGLLMNHCRRARGFLVMSTCGVYAPAADPYYPIKETDPLGGSVMRYSPTYAVSKTGQEAVARFVARQLTLPTTIARMNVSYGPNGGLPAMQFRRMLEGKPVTIVPDRRSICNPIYQDDINAQAVGMLAAASVPATIVNWAGDEAVDVQDYCRYMAEIAGLRAEFRSVPCETEHLSLDNTRRRELVGPCQVKWRDGMRRMIAARHPDIKLRGQ